MIGYNGFFNVTLKIQPFFNWAKISLLKLSDGTK